MGKIIGIISIKGGVGKTTISSSLASELANGFGKRVLLVDGNYSAPNAGIHMDIISPLNTIHDVLAGKSRLISAIHRKFGVDVIPGSYVCDEKLNYLKLKDKLYKIKNLYDFIIIDGSPSMNDEVLSTILSSDMLFVVSTPDYPTLSCSMRAAKLAKQRGKPIEGIILNKIRNPKYEIRMNEIESSVGIPVIARILDEKIHAGALFSRIPVSLYRKNASMSKELREVSRALSGELKKFSLWNRLFLGNFKKEYVNRQILQDKIYLSQFMENSQ